MATDDSIEPTTGAAAIWLGETFAMSAVTLLREAPIEDAD